MGECGLRAGYIEFMNIDQDVFKMFMKMISAKLCASALGQVYLLPCSFIARFIYCYKFIVRLVYLFARFI